MAELAPYAVSGSNTRGMDDAVAVALEFAAPLRRALGYLPSARIDPETA